MQVDKFHHCAKSCKNEASCMQHLDGMVPVMPVIIMICMLHKTNRIMLVLPAHVPAVHASKLVRSDGSLRHSSVTLQQQASSGM